MAPNFSLIPHPAQAQPGELPADTKTWLRQQQRWQDGFRHVGLRMFPEILKSRSIGLSAKLAALLHICMSFNQPVLMVGVVPGLLAGLRHEAFARVRAVEFKKRHDIGFDAAQLRGRGPGRQR